MHSRRPGTSQSFAHTMWRQRSSLCRARSINSGPLHAKFPSHRVLAAISRTPNAALVHPSRAPYRTISMRESAGKPEDLFRYTSGRWLLEEKAQQQLRYVRFDLESLCRRAAAYFSDATRCVRVVKLEGNFNKALLLTMDDGNEVIAKIPCPNAGPPSITTASEVATLKFRMFGVLSFIRVGVCLHFSFSSAVKDVYSGPRNYRLEL